MAGDWLQNESSAGRFTARKGCGGLAGWWMTVGEREPDRSRGGPAAMERASLAGRLPEPERSKRHSLVDRGGHHSLRSYRVNKGQRFGCRRRLRRVARNPRTAQVAPPPAAVLRVPQASEGKKLSATAQPEDRVGYPTAACTVTTAAAGGAGLEASRVARRNAVRKRSFQARPMATRHARSPAKVS